MQQRRNTIRGVLHEPFLDGCRAVAQVVGVTGLLHAELREVAYAVGNQLTAFDCVQMPLVVEQLVHVHTAQLGNALLLRHLVVELVNLLVYVCGGGSTASHKCGHAHHRYLFHVLYYISVGKDTKKNRSHQKILDFAHLFVPLPLIMSTVIYPSPIFGPVHSRRLGLSLGVNLLPADGKVCSFDCIYCECGFNADHRPHLPLPTREEVSEALEQRLLAMTAEGRLPDVLTFAGNGEPTCHPHFPEIINDIIKLRNRYCPEAKVSVLSNATMTGRPEVHDALMRVDNNIQKLDTVSADYINKVDRPCGAYDVNAVIEHLKAFRGHVIIQTMFMTGVRSLESQESVDNTGEEFGAPWLEAIRDIRPQQVMVYTIDRETPAQGLQKASHEQLDAIRDRVIALGIPCSASY